MSPSDDEIALTGGIWVPRGSVMHWVEIPEIKLPRHTWESSKRYDWYNLGPCPKCGAKAGEPCRSSGRTVPAHRARLEPKRCAQCDSEIPSSRTLCDDCGLERRRAQWRESKRRAVVA